MIPDPFEGFRHKIRLSFYLFIGILAAGPLGYRVILGDRYSLFDYFYMTVITVATVGYGEVVDLSGSRLGRLFTIFLIFGGMSAILYFLSNVTAFFIEGDLKDVFWRRKMQKFIDGMKDHFIVCGAGQHGLYITEEMTSTKRPVVLIDSSHERVDLMKEKLPAAGLIVGDATDGDILQMAGITRAKGLVAATNNDKDNLVITITARQLSPSLRIVTRCNEMKNAEKLRRAGADSVVSSNYIGGLRIVSDMIRPTVVTFLDRMLRDKDKNLRIEELTIEKGSRLSGTTAASVKSRALLLAVKDKEGRFEYNPPGDRMLEEGMTLIFLVTPEEREKLESLH